MLRQGQSSTAASWWSQHTGRAGPNLSHTYPWHDSTLHDLAASESTTTASHAAPLLLSVHSRNDCQRAVHLRLLLLCQAESCGCALGAWSGANICSPCSALTPVCFHLHDIRAHLSVTLSVRGGPHVPQCCVSLASRCNRMLGVQIPARLVGQQSNPGAMK